MLVSRAVVLSFAPVLLSGCSMVALVDNLSSPAQSPSEAPVTAEPFTHNDLPSVDGEGQISRYFAGMAIDDAEIVFAEALGAGGAGDGQIDLDALVESIEMFGFPPESIESTAEYSQVKLPVDSVSLGVSIDGQCLVGQVSKTWVVVEIEAQLADGSCVIQGETVPQ